MKTMTTLALTAVMIAILAVTASPAGAVTANGPYYATPAWAQKLDCTASASCPRFIVLANWSSAAVLDRETGLVWEQSPSTTTRSWESAHMFCNDKIVGNRKGWRLPTMQELASLVDPTVPSPGPTLPAGHPFDNVQSSVYWAATTRAAFTNFAWSLLIFNGTVGLFDKTDPFFVWCVRGGQGVEAQ